MELKTNVEKISETRVKVNLEIDAKSVSKQLNLVYKDYAKNINFPDFVQEKLLDQS